MPTLALVGCAHIHTPGFIKRLNNRPEITVRATWDHDPERAKKCASELHTHAVEDVSAIWSDPTIDAVVICSETNRHEQLVHEAAAAKKHLFVEKPLGMNGADADRMAAAIEQAGVIFQTGFFMRGDPNYLFLREQIHAGHFGKITRIRLTNCHSGSLGGWFDTEWRWMTDLNQAGVGAFGDLGAHVLDIMMWLLNQPVTRATASIHVGTGRYGDCDEYGEGLVEFADGTVGSLAAGWVDVAQPVPILVSGTEGHAYVAEGKLYFKSSHVPGADGEKPWTDLPLALPHAFDLFLDAVSGHANVPLVTVREAAERNAVMEALYTGSRQHTWIATR